MEAPPLPPGPTGCCSALTFRTKDEVYVSAIDYVRSAKIPDDIKAGVLGETARSVFDL
jgi:hypothetical protein